MSTRPRRRIAMMVPTFPRLSETFIVSKLLGLRSRGWDARIVAQRVDRGAWALFPELDAERRHDLVLTTWPDRPRWVVALLLPLVVLTCVALRPLRTARYLWRGWRDVGLRAFADLYLDAPIVRLAPHVVHFEFGSLAPDRMYLGQRLGAKIVVSFRGYDLNYVGLDSPAYYQPVWAHADALHLLGEDLWRRAVRRGCPAEKPRALIAPAIDARRFTPSTQAAEEAPRTRSTLRVLSVGRLEWKKGYEFALQAMRCVRDAGVDVEYRIVGDGEFRTAVAFARHQLGLEECVELVGAVPREKVLENMWWADVFLHPAVSEGFGNAVLEAQAVAVPVVCTTADGLRENIEHGVTGFSVAARDPQALASALTTLAREPALRARMGAAGRARIESRFRLADQLGAFEALYERVLDARTQAVASAGTALVTSFPSLA